MQQYELAAKVRAPMIRSDQARLRLREEMERQKLSQREVADLLKWSQSRVGKILTGRVGMDLDDLAELCFALSLPLTEVVRDHGLEFCAEMSPTELRFLERLRQLPQADRDAFLQIMDVKAKTRSQERRAAPPKKVRKTV